MRPSVVCIVTYYGRIKKICDTNLCDQCLTHIEHILFHLTTFTYKYEASGEYILKLEQKAQCHGPAMHMHSGHSQWVEL